MSDQPSRTDRFEENLIALILGLMTCLTFANVVARYVFNSNILWALELTVFLFAWLVLLGASYAVKIKAHLGVDVLIKALPGPIARLMGFFALAACLAFAFLLLKGSWDYWANFANLPKTEGRWFPLGFEERFRDKGWYETQDIPLPFFLRFLEGWFNEGEAYEKIPKLIPYFVMPVAFVLLLFRFCQAGFALMQRRVESLIASHEVEEQLESQNAETDPDTLAPETGTQRRAR